MLWSLVKASHCPSGERMTSPAIVGGSPIRVQEYVAKSQDQRSRIPFTSTSKTMPPPSSAKSISLKGSWAALQGDPVAWLRAAASRL